MANFPKLKTSAITQYPLSRRLQFRNQTVRFVDGSSQRYRDSAGARLQWDIQLTELDEGELAAVEEFFLAREGAFGNFSFTDPWDGHVYDDCSVADDDLALVAVAELRGSTRLSIVRN
jgi:phage-related protein